MTKSIREVSEVVASGENAEDVVFALDPNDLFPVLRRLEQISEMVNRYKRAVEGRMTLDGWVGEKWVDDAEHGGHTFVFARSSRGDFADIPALVQELMDHGLSLPSILEAVSKMKVTTLKALAENEKDMDKRKDILATIDEYREKVLGGARLVDLDSKYVKNAITAKKKEKD